MSKGTIELYDHHHRLYIILATTGVFTCLCVKHAISRMKHKILSSAPLQSHKPSSSSSVVNCKRKHARKMPEKTHALSHTSVIVMPPQPELTIRCSRTPPHPPATFPVIVLLAAASPPNIAFASKLKWINILKLSLPGRSLGCGRYW